MTVDAPTTLPECRSSQSSTVFSSDGESNVVLDTNSHRLRTRGCHVHYIRAPTTSRWNPLGENARTRRASACQTPTSEAHTADVPPRWDPAGEKKVFSPSSLTSPNADVRSPRG